MRGTKSGSGGGRPKSQGKLNNVQISQAESETRGCAGSSPFYIRLPWAGCNGCMASVTGHPIASTAKHGGCLRQPNER